MSALSAAEAALGDDAAIWVSVFSNPGGQAVGKVYELGPEGKPQKVKRGNPFARHCTVHRFGDALALGTFVHGMGSNAHICAGIPRDGVTDASVTTMGKPRPGAIARSNSFFQMRPGPGLGLLDHDVRSETPAHCRLTTEEFEAALENVLGWPAEAAPRVSYSSSSSFVECADGSQSTGLRGHHSLMLVADASDWHRALIVIFQRFVLAGYGWVYVGADGRQHLRTVVDDSVGRDPCRAIYSGRAELGPGLRYGSRPVSYILGKLLNTSAAVPPLTAAELALYENIAADLIAASADKAGAIRATHKQRKIAAMIALGTSEKEAARAYAGSGAQRLEGPWPIVLASGTTVTVNDVLDAPAKYHNQGCCDPVEPDYDSGRVVAKIYTDRDDVFVSSLAHGGNANGGPTVYVLSRSVVEQFDVLPAEQADNAAIAVVPFAEQRLAKTDARDGTLSTRALSELGNALRLFDAYGDGLKYINDAPAWITWADCAWRWNVDGTSVRAMAANLPGRIYAEGIGHPNDAIHFANWARRSQESRIIKAAVALLSDFAPVRLPLACIDADHFLVGLNHGRQVIDLRNGTTRAAMPSDYITKSLGAEIVGEVTKAVRWVQFLEQVFGGDQALIEWLQRFCGYLLTGSTREHIFLFCFGHGANGKSVFIEVLKSIIGDYSRAIASETLSESRRQAGGATPDLAALIGARLVLCSETEDNTALAESLVKSLVSGDTMAVRQLYAAPVEFKPNFKLVMAGNHRPIVRGNDNGIWRRIRLVPFNRTFAPEERDSQLLDKLKAETPHILAWMVAGCIAWQRDGLVSAPEAIDSATQDYRVDQDLTGRWLDECTQPCALGEATAGELYGSYSRWCIDSGLKPASTVVLGRRLSERGYTVRKSNGSRIWCGLALRDVFDSIEIDLLS